MFLAHPRAPHQSDQLHLSPPFCRVSPHVAIDGHLTEIPVSQFHMLSLYNTIVIQLQKTLWLLLWSSAFKHGINKSMSWRSRIILQWWNSMRKSMLVLRRRLIIALCWWRHLLLYTVTLVVYWRADPRCWAGLGSLEMLCAHRCKTWRCWIVLHIRTSASPVRQGTGWGSGLRQLCLKRSAWTFASNSKSMFFVVSLFEQSIELAIFRSCAFRPTNIQFS